MLIGTIDAEELLESLVCTFSLTISFRMITGGEVEFHVEEFSEGSEEGGDELRTPIGGDMLRNAVFGENVNKEKVGQIRRGDVLVARDKDTLLRGSIDDNEDRVVATGDGKALDEVHGDRVPWSECDRKRLEQTVGFMTRFLVAFARDTRFNVRAPGVIYMQKTPGSAMW